MNGIGYGNLSDNQLVLLLQKGDERAFEEITIRYVKLIYQIAYDFNIDGYEHDDLVQEGLLAFLIAGKNFDEQNGASFKNYAVMCTKNRFKDIAKKGNAKRTVPKSQIITLDEMGDRHDEEQNVEDFVIERDYLKNLMLHLRSLLSYEERTVFDMYLKGYSYDEIADTMQMSTKKIDNTLQKVKRKLRDSR